MVKTELTRTPICPIFEPLHALGVHMLTVINLFGLFTPKGMLKEMWDSAVR